MPKQTIQIIASILLFISLIFGINATIKLNQLDNTIFNLSAELASKADDDTSAIKIETQEQFNKYCAVPLTCYDIAWQNQQSQQKTK